MWKYKISTKYASSFKKPLPTAHDMMKRDLFRQFCNLLFKFQLPTILIIKDVGSLVKHIFWKLREN